MKAVQPVYYLLYQYAQYSGYILGLYFLCTIVALNTLVYKRPIFPVYYVLLSGQLDYSRPGLYNWCTIGKLIGHLGYNTNIIQCRFGEIE